MTKFRTIIAGLLLTALPTLSACDPTAVLNTISTTVPQSPADVNTTTIPNRGVITLTLKKGYLGALQTSVGLEQAASTAVDLGIIKQGSPTAIKVADLLETLHKAMGVAKTALKVNDALQLETQINNITGLKTQISSLLGIKA